MCDSTGGPRRPQLGRWRRALLALASVMAPAGAVRADRKVDLGHDGAYHLPSGIAVRPDLVALRGGLSASLPLPRPARAFAELRGVRLGAGDSVVLELGNCCASLSSMTLPLSDIEARLALAEGQALRRQGKPGEAAKAFVSLKPGKSQFSLEDLRTFLADKLGIGPTPWENVMRLFRTAGVLGDRAARLSPRVRRRAVSAGEKYWDDVVRLGLSGGPYDFRPADRLGRVAPADRPRAP